MQYTITSMESNGCAERVSLVAAASILKLDEYLESLPARYRRHCAAKIADIRQMHINIINNTNLCIQFTKCAIARYGGVGDALLHRRSPGQIIVHVPDIGEYGVFTPESYCKMLGNYKSAQQMDLDEDDPAPVAATQIVFTSDQQKLIMLYTGADAISKVKHIEAMATNYFKASVRITHAGDALEITVKDTRLSSFADATRLFQQFTTHVHGTQPDMFLKFHQPPVFPYGDHSYFTKDITTIDESVGNILELLGTISCGSQVNLIVNNINATTANIVNGNTKTTTTVVARATKYPFATAWINSNNPAVDEVTSAYYKRYSTAMVTAGRASTCAVEFSKLMKELGYISRGGSGRKTWASGNMCL